MSRVDVFVPCYNYARFLRQCVESVLAQDGVEVRVLILDDASQDDSEAVGRQLASEDQRVEYRRHTINRGHIETYNEGIEWANGDYTLLLSADDLLTSGALARAAGLMNVYSDVGLTYGKEIRTPAPAFLSYHAPDSYGTRILSGSEFLETSCTLCNNIVPTPTAVVRTSVQRKVGGYKKALSHTGDLEMWLRFAAHSSVAEIDACQAFYRVHGANMSYAYSGMRELTQLRLAFDLFFAECGDFVPDCGRLRGLVRRGLGREAFWGANQAFEANDKQLCREFLKVALELSPRLRLTGGWWRLWAKRLIGGSLYSWLRCYLRGGQVSQIRRADEIAPGSACISERGGAQ
jgi:glycosyltransferase involved in cell wall biosynthesis